MPRAVVTHEEVPNLVAAARVRPEHFGDVRHDAPAPTQARRLHDDVDRRGELVAKGEAEIGFQQVSELLPVAGIDVVRELPPGIDKVEIFSTGLHAKAPQPGIACEFVRHLVAAEAVPVMRRTGLDPLTGSA